MRPLAAKSGESILPCSPALWGEAAAVRSGLPMGAGYFSCMDLWDAEAALAWGKNWEFEKNPKPTNQAA